jgi:hypothetical protein
MVTERFERLGKLKIHLIGTPTRYLPVCSIVPQPTTLTRDPNLLWVLISIADELRKLIFNGVPEKYSLKINAP